MRFPIVRASGSGSTDLYELEISGEICTQDEDAGYCAISQFVCHLKQISVSISSPYKNRSEQTSYSLIIFDVRSPTEHHCRGPIILRCKGQHNSASAGRICPDRIRNVINAALITLVEIQYGCLPIRLHKKLSGRKQKCQRV